MHPEAHERSALLAEEMPLGALTQRWQRRRRPRGAGQYTRTDKPRGRSILQSSVASEPAHSRLALSASKEADNLDSNPCPQRRMFRSRCAGKLDELKAKSRQEAGRKMHRRREADSQRSGLRAARGLVRRTRRSARRRRGRTAGGRRCVHSGGNRFARGCCGSRRGLVVSRRPRIAH